MKAVAKKPSKLHAVMIAPFLRLMDKMSGRHVPRPRVKRELGKSA
jgi:hypothetical protein